VELDVTLFDMTGISENANSKAMIQKERQSVLDEMIPAVYLQDYKLYSDDIALMRRIHRYPWAYKLVWFIERCLFKLEKGKNKRKGQQIWG
jgi:hypothetical protein